MYKRSFPRGLRSLLFRLSILWRRDPQPHRNHRRLNKTVMAEKFLRYVLRPVGQQRNAKEIFLFGKIDRMLEKPGTVTLALVLLVDHEIFQQDNKAALSGADGK